jgi:hypothetical protein
MRTSENKSVHKILLLFCGVVYNSNGLLGVTTARTGVDQVLHIPDLVHGVTRLPASSTNRAVDFGNKKKIGTTKSPYVYNNPRSPTRMGLACPESKGKENK